MPQIDMETRQLLTRIESQLGEVATIKSAVSQLEEQVRATPQMIQQQMKAIRAQTFDGNGRYRGMFGSEDEVRAFGLLVMSSCGAERARDALKKEHSDIYQRAMGETNDSAGGTFVPHEFYRRLIDLAETYGVFFQKAMRWPMGSESGSFPRIEGELDVYCPGEGVEPTDSDLPTGSNQLNAKKWVVLSYYSDELGEDSAVDVGEVIGRLMARGIAKKADQIGFVGDGSSTYFNITGIVPRLTASGMAGMIEFAGHDAYAEVTDADLINMMAAIPEYADANAEWYCTRKFWTQVMVRLTRAAGGVTAEEFEGRRRKAFAGYPVNVVQAMSSTEADEAVPVLFGDLSSAATWGDRKSMAIKRSTEYKFGSGLVTVKGDIRVAINVHDVGNTSNAGPIVAGSLETTS